jgi:hypothetical protein
MTKCSSLNSYVLFMVENYLCILHSNSQILDNICDFLNCKTIIENKENRRLYKGKVDSCFGNGAKFATLELIV